MRPNEYHAHDLVRLMRGAKIATMGDLKAALGTQSDATVFRKLSELDYRTSYSHRGRYYTLDNVTRFDALGLWSFRSVWFSQFGTLVATVESLVTASEGGYRADEAETVLHVDCKAALVGLVRAGRLARESVAARYVYLSAHGPTRRGQLAARAVHDAAPSHLGLGVGLRVLPTELKAAIVLFYSLLDERQRRLYAGLEALTSIGE